MSWGGEIAFYLGLLLILLMSGMWVPFAIGIGAMVAMYMGGGWSTFQALGMVAWSTMDGFTLSAIPLFILMAEVLSLSGISRTYYSGLTVLVRRLPKRLQTLQERLRRQQKVPWMRVRNLQARLRRLQKVPWRRVRNLQARLRRDWVKLLAQS